MLKKGDSMTRGIFMRFPEGKTKALTFSYDDGFLGDEQLIGIFNKHGLKGTFNVNTSREELQDTARYSIYNGHEVAVHTVNHPFLDAMPGGALVDEILEDRKALEKITGKIVTGMAYPFHRGGEKIDEALTATGISYARVTAPTYKFTLPENWYLWHPTCHHNDEKLDELADTFLTADPNTNMYKYEPLLFYVWGHSFEFVNNDNWYVMENFAKKVENKPEVWYATNKEIYRYVEQYKRLEFSVDLSKVYNPTSDTMYFFANEKTQSVRPGETIYIK